MESQAHPGSRGSPSGGVGITHDSSLPACWAPQGAHSCSHVGLLILLWAEEQELAETRHHIPLPSLPGGSQGSGVEPGRSRGLVPSSAPQLHVQDARTGRPPRESPQQAESAAGPRGIARACRGLSRPIPAQRGPKRCSLLCVNLPGPAQRGGTRHSNPLHGLLLPGSSRS